MAKLVKSFIIFGPSKGNIKVIRKYAELGATVDEGLMSTLCLPRIELVNKPAEPRFLTFLVTKEDGQVLYGSGLIVQERYLDQQASFCYTLITDLPFVHATRSLLQLIWSTRCDEVVIKAILNIPLPAKKRCLRVEYLDSIYIYRGMADLPLLDYPLRELFEFLQIDDFLLAYACILMEFRTLIISQDNYKLMMVGEALTSLLLPLKWCNVYVPILPPVYGATYLDAPTSYIMGINTQVTELPDNLNHVQCRIYCDESRVVCSVDSLTLPLFLNDLKRDIMQITADFQQLYSTNTFTYLDDLKFNRAIRILFIKTIRKNILANYERYIVDVPESSAEIRQFDVVSYLSDQPEFMRSFLSKFLDTQLFASFVDENARRLQQSRLSVFDMDPDELSEHFSDEALEQAFERAQRIHLMDLRQDLSAHEVKTVPASPMKLRRQLPDLAALRNRLAFKSKLASRSTSVDNNNVQPVTLVNVQSIADSPPVHRNSVATISLKGQHPLLFEKPSRLFQINDSLLEEASDNQTHNNNNNSNTNSPSSRSNAPSQPVPNGKIIELINEVKELTKRILIEKMGDPVLDGPLVGASRKLLANGSRGGRNNTLIGNLCDLIERVWAHGAYRPHQESSSAYCPLWEHLIAFTRSKYIDTKPTARHELFANGSHLSILSPKSERTELERMLDEPRKRDRFNLNNWFKINRSFERIGPMARDLIDDLRIIHMLKDVKTDIGKARAFIRLSLEHKKLSKHLKTLISDQTLLNSLYKPYAFLRCEDEREQFLMYLLTLNAVDLPCFTTTFVSVIETRRLVGGSKATA